MLFRSAENIATDICTAEDWDNPNALESLKEDLNSLTVVDEDEAIEDERILTIATTRELSRRSTQQGKHTTHEQGMMLKQE